GDARREASGRPAYTDWTAARRDCRCRKARGAGRPTREAAALHRQPRALAHRARPAEPQHAERLMGAIPPGLGPILCVVGARPNYMKMAPLLAAFARHPGLPRAVLVHTGQHYDSALDDQLFAGLQLPPPDLNLEV